METYKINDLYIGQSYQVDMVISEGIGKEFAKISQDYNPIHLNQKAAIKSRFGRKIVHGMLIGSYFSGIIGDKFPGQGSIYLSQEVMFKRPVYYDENIIIKVEVLNINLEKKHVELLTQCLDSKNNILVDGKAKILLDNE